MAIEAFFFFLHLCSYNKTHFTISVSWPKAQAVIKILWHRRVLVLYHSLLLSFVQTLLFVVTIIF